jgi:hypothetical protein
MAGGGVGEAMLISAAVGGATSAATGGDPLKGALLGAATGGAFHGLAGAPAAGASSAGASSTANTAAGLDATLAASNTLPSAGAPLTTTGTTAGTSLTGTTAGQAGFGTSAVNPVTGTPVASSVNPFQVGYVDPLAGSQVGASATGTNIAGADQAKMFPELSKFYEGNKMAARVGSGVLASALGDTDRDQKEEDEYGGPLRDFSYSRSGYTPYRAASGGLMDTAVARRMAGGGHLGSYSDGGQLLKGREADSNGMKDDIPASIEGSQPALLADGEFVIPADVVSGLGNGSTEAGARELYAMMEKVREARTGRSKQAPEIDADRMMPA